MRNGVTQVWARTIRTSVGTTEEGEPEFSPIKKSGVAKTLAFRIFWVSLHLVTCLMFVLGNVRALDR